MSETRRDFLKGLAALAAIVPGVALVRKARAGSAPPGPEGDPMIRQKHGRQPEFYVMSWNKTCDVDLINRGLGPPLVMSKTTLIELDIYTEYPRELAAWCDHNHLTVDLPKLGKHQLYVNNFSVWAAGVHDDLTITLEGIVQ